jgi:hypothetical protein
MLDAAGADTTGVISRALKTAAWVCCLLLLASFALFVRDQLVNGSAHQQALLGASVTPTPATPHRAGQPRRFIDGAAHDLTQPFASMITSNSQWVLRGLPTAFALIVYGGGLGFAARYARGMA